MSLFRNLIPGEPELMERLLRMTASTSSTTVQACASLLAAVAALRLGASREAFLEIAGMYYDGAAYWMNHARPLPRDCRDPS